MSSWSSPADRDPTANPAGSTAGQPAGSTAGDEVAVVPPAPWWSEPVEPDGDVLPTMAQLDALSAELDEVDAALASMDARALAGGGVPDRAVS